MSVSTLGPGRKVLKNHGDFQAEGDSILLLKGVSPNLQGKKKKKTKLLIRCSKLYRRQIKEKKEIQKKKAAVTVHAKIVNKKEEHNTELQSH